MNPKQAFTVLVALITALVEAALRNLLITYRLTSTLRDKLRNCFIVHDISAVCSYHLLLSHELAIVSALLSCRTSLVELRLRAKRIC